VLLNLILFPFHVQVTTIKAVLESVKSSGPLDKASEKILLGVIVSFEPLANGGESNDHRKNSFMDCAPALRELVQITSNYWEDSSIMTTTRPVRRAARKRISVIQEDEEDENNEDEEAGTENSGESSIDSDDYDEPEEVKMKNQKKLSGKERKSASILDSSDMYFEDVQE
jgi:hypothetical protein